MQETIAWATIKELDKLYVQELHHICWLHETSWKQNNVLSAPGEYFHS